MCLANDTGRCSGNASFLNVTDTDMKFNTHNNPLLYMEMLRLRKVGSLAQDSESPPPTGLSFQHPLALQPGGEPSLLFQPTGTLLLLEARPPALFLSSPWAGLLGGTQFPFNLFKAGPQPVAPIRADPFLLVTEACKMDQPYFSSLASGALPGPCSVISLV